MATKQIISSKDAILLSTAPTTNTGTDTYLNIGYLSSTTRFNGILYFDASSVEALNNTVTSATLSIYYYTKGVNYNTTRTHVISRVTRDDWTELGVTWDKYDGTNNWTTAGGDYTGTDSVDASVDTTPGEWITWNITNIVNTCFSSQSKHVNLMFQVTSGALNNDDTVFYSKDYTGDTSLRPKLDITYTPAPTGGAFLLNMI